MDNYFKDCPAMMSDGRLFTDYRTDVRANEYIKYINSIDNNDKYRIFLQSNATNFMDNEWNVFKEINSLFNCHIENVVD